MPINLTYKHLRLLKLTKAKLAQNAGLVNLTLLNLGTIYPRYRKEAMEISILFEENAKKNNKNALWEELQKGKVQWLDIVTSFLETVFKNSKNAINRIT